MNIQDEVLKKFKQPLRYDKEDQRIFDADNRLVVDVRAWGYLSSTIKNQQLAAQIQDELGEMIAKAFNHCYSKVNCNKHGVMQGLTDLELLQILHEVKVGRLLAGEAYRKIKGKPTVGKAGEDASVSDGK